MYIEYREAEMEGWDDLADDVEEATQQAMKEIANEVEWEARRLAAGSLKESLRAYLDGLSVETYGNEVQVQLDGGLATAVEAGSESFDLKPGFNVSFSPLRTRVIPLTGKEPLRFRTAPYSSRQPFTPWQHPGIKARNFISKAFDKVESADLNRIFEEAFQSRIKL